MEQKVGRVERGAALAEWRPTAVVVLLLSYFGLFGLLIGAQGVLWAEVIRALGLSEGAFGTVQLISPLLSVLLLLASGQLSNRLGKKWLSLAGLALQFASCLALAATGSLAALVGMLLLSGLGNGMLEAGMNGAALDWERARGRGVMNSMHASFSGGAVLGALLAGALLNIGWGYGGVMLLVAALYAVALLLSLPVVFPPVEHSPGEGASLGVTLRLLGRPALLLLALICLLGVFGEGAAMTWSVIYLRDELQAAALVGGIAFALFNVAMFVGRLANELLVARWGARASLLLSGALMTLASLLLVATTQVWIFTLALVLLGVAVAGVVPTVLTAAGQVAPGNSGTITGGIMAVAYLSFVIGAPLVGWLAELTSLRAALLTLTAGGVLLAGLAWRVGRGR